MPLHTLAICALQLTLVTQPGTTPPARNTSEPGAAQPTATAKPEFKATTPEVHGGTEARHEQFNKISKEGKAKLVFLGDSITQSWDGSGKPVWDQFYGTRNAANFGISGDRTEHVLWRLDHGNFDGLKPSVIVVMIGTNNTGHRKDPAPETAAGVKAIVERLRTKCPDAKVLLLGIFPRGEKPDDEMRKINVEINALIEPLADGEHVFWKDVGAAFLDEHGTLRKDLMPDFLHPNFDGYKIWAEQIEPDVAKLLGDAKPDEPEKKK